MSASATLGRLRTSPGAGASNLRRNLALARELAWTQFKLKYTGSVLGYLWSLLKPLMLFSIMFTIFVVLFHQRANEFALQLLVGIVFFTFFTECTAGAMGSIVGSTGLIQKAYFPRYILVVAASMTATLTFLINLTLIVVVATPLGHLHMGMRSLWTIPLILELYMLALGLSLLLAALFVFYRDLGHIWEIVTQVVFYASAVVYPITLVPERFRGVFFLNPVAQIIEDVRHALVIPVVPTTASVVGIRILVPIALAVAMLVLGVFAFRRLSPLFAENL